MKTFMFFYAFYGSKKNPPKAVLRNGVKIKYPFDAHILSPYILFLSLNSPAIRLKKQSSGLKICCLK
jgi:hypothetical protein